MRVSWNATKTRMDALLPYGGSDWPKVAKKQMCGNIKNRKVAPLLLRDTITEVLHAVESPVFPRGSQRPNPKNNMVCGTLCRS